jgi:glycosyltransferase involved in cell wall biosynthesis
MVNDSSPQDGRVRVDCVRDDETLDPGRDDRANEARGIEAALRSLYPVVDEIVLVDTGSTDATVAVAERVRATLPQGACRSMRFLHEPWHNDFSRARNFVQDATSESCGWIVVWTANEVLEPGNLRDVLPSRGQPGRLRASSMPSVTHQADNLVSPPTAFLHAKGWPLSVCTRIYQYHHRQRRGRCEEEWVCGLTIGRPLSWLLRTKTKR